MLNGLTLDKLTPDLPEPILAELRTGRTALARQLRELLRRAGNVQNALAWIRQRKMKAIGDRLEQCHIEGLGQLVARIDPEIMERTAVRTGNPQWFRDKRVLHQVLEENPHLRVRCNSRTFQVRISGFRTNDKPKGPRDQASGAGKPCAPTVSGSIKQALTSRGSRP